MDILRPLLKLFLQELEDTWGLRIVDYDNNADERYLSEVVNSFCRNVSFDITIRIGDNEAK